MTGKPEKRGDGGEREREREKYEYKQTNKKGSKKREGGKKGRKKNKVCIFFFSHLPGLSILPPPAVKALLLEPLFRFCCRSAGRRRGGRGYQKKRDNLLIFVDI